MGTEHDEKVASILKNENKGFFKRQFSIVADLWSFMRVRKKWWLLPILLTLVIVGALVIFSQSSALSPFIYALF
ncbi:hypothetical protein HYU20_03775 [Candidatus Woesearchaeota archaeon]|nr:hypothetical protein [Candidatus Woesearchaeota archaeon]